MNVTPEILARAKAFWAERDLRFPRFVRQTWEQGTDLAKEATIREVMRRDSEERRQAETAQPAQGEARPNGSRSEIAQTEHPTGEREGE